MLLERSSSKMTGFCLPSFTKFNCMGHHFETEASTDYRESLTVYEMPDSKSKEEIAVART